MSAPCSVAKIVFSCILGLVLLLLASVSIFFLDNVIHEQMKKHLPLRNSSSSMSFKSWKDIPVPILTSFYFYHVENPYEIIYYGEKPILTEKGPFVYKQRRHKVEVIFSENGSIVDYKEISMFHFDAERSKGKESDLLRVLNVPLLTVVNKAQYKPLPDRIALDTIIAMTKTEMFMTRSAKELIWGYDDPLLVELKKLKPSWVPLTRFGWFMDKNNTDGGRFQIFTGQHGDLDDFLKINKWNGKKKLDFWRGDSCNALNGTDGSMFGPFLTPERTLHIFSADMCRSFAARFSGEGAFDDMDTLTFEMDPNIFAAASADPTRACFCTPDDSHCLGNGVLNVSNCNYGAPVIVSQPHFLNADQTYLRAVEGLHPDPAKHQTYFHVEPHSGVTVAAEARVQVNGFVKNIQLFEYLFKRFPDKTVFPVWWLEEGVSLDSKTAALLQSQVVWRIHLVHAVEALFFVVAAFVLASGVLLTVHRWHYRKYVCPPDDLVPVMDDEFMN